MQWKLRADGEAAKPRAPEQPLVQLGLGNGQHEDLVLAQKPRCHKYRELLVVEQPPHRLGNACLAEFHIGTGISTSLF